MKNKESSIERDFRKAAKCNNFRVSSFEKRYTEKGELEQVIVYSWNEDEPPPEIEMGFK